MELYQRLVHGQLWEGEPVDQVHGSPSVHNILERLGLLESEDDGGSTSDPAPISETSSPPTPKPTKTISPKAKKPERPPLKRKRTSTSERQSYSRSSGPAVTVSSQAANQPPLELVDDDFQSRHSPQLPTSLNASGGGGGGGGGGPRNSSLASSNSLLTADATTATRWDSPGFCDEIFSTPTPTPKAMPDAYHHHKQYQTASVQAQPAEFYPADPADPAVFPFFPAEMETAAAGGMEACSAEYLFDATSGMGMAMYGWETPSGPAVPFTVPEGTTWDTGVFV